MQSRYIYFVNLFLIYFKWFQIYSIGRTKRTSIYSTQEVVILSRKPETHFIVLVCWLCDLIYKILSSFTKTIFSPAQTLWRNAAHLLWTGQQLRGQDSLPQQRRLSLPYQLRPHTT